MIGIGIDTGGTCTDAVIIESETNKVLSWAKTQTTKQDLKIGILKALSGLNGELVKKAEYLSLSTTLATNACVENKGGHAKLVFIGLNPKAVERVGSMYGLPRVSEIYFIEDTTDAGFDIFRQDVRDSFGEYDSVALVQINPSYDDGALEKRAEAIVKQELSIPVIRGYDLYQEINVQKRGATALLNARLLPVMNDFFKSIDVSLKELGLDIPVNVVKSDGSIMSKDYALTRPVETLLSGPAASIIGATVISDRKDALIVDMGGTTSDCAIIRGGIPVTSASGITVGEWKTMVKGVTIDTFALGGDTGVSYDHGEMHLEERRVVPISVLAYNYPEIIPKLELLVNKYRLASYPACTFLILQNEPQNPERFTQHERRLIEVLKRGPHLFSEAAAAIGLSPYTIRIERLENEGIILRSSVTPTDAMHVKGVFTGYSCEAAELGIRYYSYALKKSRDEIVNEIYNLVGERLYSNLTGILLRDEMLQAKREEIDLPDYAELRKITRYMYKGRKSSHTYMKADFNASMDIVGIGAPTGVFVGETAELMNTEADVPQYSMVANAVGAAVGNIRAEYNVKIVPFREKYQLLGGEKIEVFEYYSDAVKRGKEIAKDKAGQKAIAQGAKEVKNVKIEVREDYFNINSTGNDRIHVETLVVGIAEM